MEREQWPLLRTRVHARGFFSFWYIDKHLFGHDAHPKESYIVSNTSRLLVQDHSFSNVRWIFWIILRDIKPSSSYPWYQNFLFCIDQFSACSGSLRMLFLVTEIKSKWIEIPVLMLKITVESKKRQEIKQNQALLQWITRKTNSIQEH